MGAGVVMSVEIASPVGNLSLARCTFPPLIGALIDDRWTTGDGTLTAYWC